MEDTCKMKSDYHISNTGPGHSSCLKVGHIDSQNGEYVRKVKKHG